MENVETYVINMTDKKEDKNIFSIGKHKFVSLDGSTWEWEINFESRKELLNLFAHKLNI